MLDEDWERQQGEELLVQSQLKRVQEDLRRINRDIAKGLKKKLTLKEKIGEREGWVGGGGGRESHLATCIISLCC